MIQDYRTQIRSILNFVIALLGNKHAVNGRQAEEVGKEKTNLNLRAL
jgi:hypothetical protein